MGTSSGATRLAAPVTLMASVDCVIGGMGMVGVVTLSRVGVNAVMFVVTVNANEVSHGGDASVSVMV